MDKVVVIHASLDDAHAATVANRLCELRVPVVVLNREQYATHWTIAGHDDDIIINAGDRKCGTEDVRSVLWRRDFLAEPGWIKWDGLSLSQRQLIADQRCLHVESCFKRLALSCPFVNPILANRTANSKVLQHHVARKCGLSVPPSYLGSDPAQAERFVRDLWSRGRRCCTKSLESAPLEIDGVKHVRLTKLFTADNLPELDGLAACPMIFQEYIEKRYEYRVFVVGEKVFACQIDSQAAGGNTAVDWRNYNFAATPHHAAGLKKDLSDRLVDLVRSLGLVYGAIDLVETPQGEFYFLEINSMGQWLWIEDMTGLPISLALARHLAG